MLSLAQLSPSLFQLLCGDISSLEDKNIFIATIVWLTVRTSWTSREDAVLELVRDLVDKNLKQIGKNKTRMGHINELVQHAPRGV